MAWYADSHAKRGHWVLQGDGAFGGPISRVPVRWFGGGPGEAYPDTAAGSAVGLWEADVDDLQTP